MTCNVAKHLSVQLGQFLQVKVPSQVYLNLL